MEATSGRGCAMRPNVSCTIVTSVFGSEGCVREEGEVCSWSVTVGPEIWVIVQAWDSCEECLAARGPATLGRPTFCCVSVLTSFPPTYVYGTWGQSYYESRRRGNGKLIATHCDCWTVDKLFDAVQFAQ